jgi:hypothetical protein
MLLPRWKWDVRSFGTFRDNLSVPAWPLKKGPIGCSETTFLRCVKPQKSDDLKLNTVHKKILIWKRTAHKSDKKISQMFEGLIGLAERAVSGKWRFKGSRSDIAGRRPRLGKFWIWWTTAGLEMQVGRQAPPLCTHCCHLAGNLWHRH